MAYTTTYNKALIASAKHGVSLAKRHSKAEMLEIFEAWVTAGLVGLIDGIGHAAALQMVKDKMGDPAPPRSVPRLVVDNVPVQTPCVPRLVVDNVPVQTPCDCA